MNTISTIVIIATPLLAAIWSVVYYLAYAVRSQVLGTTVWRGPRDKNEVALTFDDGPGGQTVELLEVLKQQDVKATFFLIGERASKHPDVVRRIIVEGHEIGNHSLTHRIFLYCTGGTILTELEKTQQLISAIVGFRPRVVRPPCGVRSPAYFRAADALGLKTIQWDVAGFDWKYRSPEMIAEAVLSKVRPGSIILLHDGDSEGKQDRRPTVESIPLIADGLRRRGLTVVPLGDMLQRIEPVEHTSTTNSREVIDL